MTGGYSSAEEAVLRTNVKEYGKAYSGAFMYPHSIRDMRLTCGLQPGGRCWPPEVLYKLLNLIATRCGELNYIAPEPALVNLKECRADDWSASPVSVGRQR